MSFAMKFNLKDFIKMILLFLIFIIPVFSMECQRDCYESLQRSHHLRGLSGDEINDLFLSVRKQSSLKDIFKMINVIRPVGSENHTEVREYIKDFMTSLGWKVELDEFTSQTVIGTIKFTNIIATQNSAKSRSLVLACHYDSLLKSGFYGSIDSAMPCSLIMSAAQILNDYLNKSKLNVTLQLIFFDGEEAFINWSEYDSLYGSRHLADMWNESLDNCGCSKLASIDTLVLLDLLGSKKPSFYNFQYNNAKLFDSLVRVEKRISFQKKLLLSEHQYFNPYDVDSYIADDHVPFLRKNVPVLHIIPRPFPSQWHELSDNADNINWDSSKDLEFIIISFIAEYFHLPLNIISE